MMHPRTWLSLLSLPLVGAFTYPVLVQESASVRPAARSGSEDPLAGLSDVQDVLKLVQDNYVDPPDMPKVVAGGIQAALERAHPMNALLTPEELRQPDPGPAEAGMKVIKLKPGVYAQVISVTPGGPADKAGIQPGDVIRKVDGEPVGNLSAWELERRLRGPEGSPLSLLRYANATGDLKKVEIARHVLSRAAVTVQKGEGAALAVLPDLRPGRAQELKGALSGLDASQTLVLDLRKAGEGELAEAAAVAGLFAKDGTLATIQEPGKPDRTVAVKAAPGQLPAFKRVVLLTAPTTQGAAEALVSCLKKAGLAVVGEKTYGLGIERTRVPLRSGGAVELVSRRWVGAGGEKLDRAGVVPTVPLKGLTEDNPLAKVLPALDEAAKALQAPAKAS